MIIAISDAPSWNHRLLMLTAHLLVRSTRCSRCSSSSLRARIHRARRRHRHAEPLAQLDDGADDRFELHAAGRPRDPAASTSCARRPFPRPAMRWSIEIGSSMPSLPATASVSVMISRTTLRRVGVADQLLERAAGQRADRIERDVAEQLHPDLVTEPRGDRTAEPGRDQRLGNRLGPVRLAAVGLAEADAVALGVMDHAGLGDVGRKVGERSDHAPRLDRRPR